MLAHTASPAAAIDVSHLSAFDIGCTAGCEALNVFAIVVKTGRCNAQGVSYGSTGTCCIKVLDNSSTKQIDIGISIYVTATENALTHL